MTNITAALIDMDGVLYDSMPYHAKAWHKMFKEYGVKTDPDEFFLYEGMTGAATINHIINRELGRDATEQEKKELYARKAEIFIESGKKKMMPGALRMLKALKRKGIDTVLVTGSGQGSLLDNLDIDYPGFFPPHHRVTAFDVKNGKPNPEPYLKGLEKAGAPSGQAIVIENAPLGVKAGKAAGCFTIAVTTGPIPREEFEKANADMIFPSMDALADWLERSNTCSPGKRLDETVKTLNPDMVVVVTDANVEEKVMPLLFDSETVAKSERVVLLPGEDHKNLESVEKIWETLEKVGATRSSMIVNIGGGMITDIGGFAAATFKRGIRYVNLPTSLLGAVDAATGGKTGVNFKGLKNEVGAFHLPSEVIISSLPLSRLHHRELMSGYAEMVKTGLIADKGLYESLLNVEDTLANPERLEEMMKRCVAIKEEVVTVDPKETGLRKILNFGHTAGHAFESLLLSRGAGIPHGEAVAHGMLVELILSNIATGLQSKVPENYAAIYLKPYYNRLNISCDDVDSLLRLMASDKKNKKKGQINFTLLKEIGVPEIDRVPSVDEVKESLDIYRDIME